MINFRQNHKKRSSRRDERGVALLVAVLITSVAMLFSYAVTSIAVKELTLTQAGRDSQIAFYASNSGIECALFHDLRNNAFDPYDTPSGDNIRCAGRDVSINATSLGLWPRRFTSGYFLINGQANGPCFDITIIKDQDSEGNITTSTESRGYNTCDLDSPRRLERALRATY